MWVDSLPCTPTRNINPSTTSLFISMTSSLSLALSIHGGAFHLSGSSAISSVFLTIIVLVSHPSTYVAAARL